MAKRLCALIATLFIGGCATQAKQNFMHVGVADVQSRYYSSEQHQRNLGLPKKVDVLEEAYGYALSKRVEEILADVRVSNGFICDFSIALIPGGQVVRTDLSGCPLDAEIQSNINAALMQGRLPYRGYESVFRRIHYLEACAPKSFCSK